MTSYRLGTLSEKHKKDSILKLIKSTTHEFANSTTIHGITYVFDRGIKAFDNLLWLLVVFFGAGIAVYMSVLAWNTWKEAPVLTSVSSTGLPLQKIDFPAITICSQGLIQVYIFFSKAWSRRPFIHSSGGSEFTTLILHIPDLNLRS